jgi:hypothetical protein
VSRWSLAGGELTWLRGTGARAAGPDRTALALAGGRVFLAGLETAANAPPDAPQVSRVRAFAADSGAPAWDIVEPPDSGAGVPSLAARGARVVVSFGDAVALLNAGSGSLLWRVGAEAVREVALADDGSALVRAVSPFVGSTAPPVSRLAAADGSVQWQVSGTQIGGMAYGWAVAPGASRLASLGSTDFVCCGAVRAQTLTLIDAATGAVASAPPLDAVRPQVPPRVLGLAQGGLVIATAEWTATAAQLRIMRVNEATGSALWQTLVPVPMQPGALRLAVTALDVGPDGTIGVAGGAVGSGNLGSTVAVTLSPDDGIQIAHYVPPAGVVDGSTFVAWGVFNVWGDAGGNLLLRADRSSRAGSDLSYESLLRQLTPGGMAWERVTWPSEATTPLLVTAERVVVTERVGSGRVVSALSRASGVVQWSTPDIVWATSAAASPPGDRVHLLETITIAGTGDEEVRVRTLDLATGDFVWSRSLATGRLGFAGFSALAREAGGSLFVHFVRDGIRAWRLAGSDGQVEWQRDLPIEAGWRTGGGRMVQLGDGRIGYTLSRRMPSLAESTPLALGHLEVLDGSSGARLGTFATLGAQAPGAAGAIDPPVLATGLGVPVFTARRADPATGPVFEVASLPRPQRNAGDVTLELLAREPVAEDGTVERITVRLRYTGVVPNLALALRAGAASGVSIFAVACAGEAGATCGAADTAPALAVPVSLSDGGAATVAFTVAVPAWLDEPGQLYLGVEGDYRIDDADLANHTLQLPMRAVLLADSFE